ncbi:MAG: class I SAM-dependent methyltransferase [Bacteroidales bacterium]|jgi:ubiquinone/menaquinone biosynthesis C-methylase UbiE
MNDFDIKASEWDNNPMHWNRSEAIAKEIIKLIPLRKEMTALEYGAGTGITSFILKDQLKEITLMDDSSEMVKVMNEKIESSQTKNLKTLNFNLEVDEYKDGKFDLIFTQMVLHHVIDIDRIIKKFHQLLNPHSYLAIADLKEEDGSFHGEGFIGHKGFNLDSLSDILRRNHFSDISHKTCFVIDRKISETESKQFEVFIMVSKSI